MSRIPTLKDFPVTDGYFIPSKQDTRPKYWLKLASIILTLGTILIVPIAIDSYNFLINKLWGKRKPQDTKEINNPQDAKLETLDTSKTASVSEKTKADAVSVDKKQTKETKAKEILDFSNTRFQDIVNVKNTKEMLAGALDGALLFPKSFVEGVKQLSNDNAYKTAGFVMASAAPYLILNYNNSITMTAILYIGSIATYFSFKQVIDFVSKPV